MGMFREIKIHSARNTLPFMPPKAPLKYKNTYKANLVSRFFQESNSWLFLQSAVDRILLTSSEEDCSVIFVATHFPAIFDISSSSADMLWDSVWMLVGETGSVGWVIGTDSYHTTWFRCRLLPDFNLSRGSFTFIFAAEALCHHCLHAKLHFDSVLQHKQQRQKSSEPLNPPGTWKNQD